MLPFRKFLPTLNRILIKKIVPTIQTKAGIIIEKPNIMNYGEVVAAGEGRMEEGKRVPMVTKLGDIVLLPEYGGSTFKLSDGEEYSLYRDEDILGILEDPKV